MALVVVPVVVVVAVGVVVVVGAAPGCSPHSVLANPAHRPARGSSPGATGRVHGAQPMEG